MDILELIISSDNSFLCLYIGRVKVINCDHTMLRYIKLA